MLSSNSVLVVVVVPVVLVIVYKQIEIFIRGIKTNLLKFLGSFFYIQKSFKLKIRDHNTKIIPPPNGSWFWW